MLDTDAPSLVPYMLQEAETLLGLMQSGPPDTVAALAEFLSVAARSAGELEIAEAAAAVSRGASHGAPIILTSPIQRLTNAIEAAQTRVAA